jgi:secreted PhoX family phosphatase
VFEVPSSARGLVDPVPLTGLGRFNHEAVAIDPRTGIAYLTEDQDDSLLYRFIPNEPGRFAAGGRLQALALRDWPAANTSNHGRRARRFPEREPVSVRWIDLDRTDAPEDDLRVRGHAAGAALFSRGEGMCLGPDGIYFACTDGGAIEAGQIFRYRPGRNEGSPEEEPGELELFVESRDPRQLENCDNLVATPWGDLLACEDADQPCALVGIAPNGGLYTFAENNYSASELAGACFAPDGRILFVNLQSPGLTLAITGPFPA